MNYRPDLEGPITAQTLPFLLASVPRDVAGVPAEQTGETDSGALIFARTHNSKRRGNFAQKFTLFNKSGNVQIVELNEDKPAAKVADTEPAADTDNGDVLGVNFASSAVKSEAVKPLARARSSADIRNREPASRAKAGARKPASRAKAGARKGRSKEA